jgi:intergrase/recombinase
MSVAIKFACLTGRRPSEAVESVRLINDKEAFSKYYNSIRGALEHLKFHALFLRSTKKEGYSWLRQSRVEIEIIDFFLQGRVPKSVFARHYFTRSLTYREKVLCALDKLKN